MSPHAVQPGNGAAHVTTIMYTRGSPLLQGREVNLQLCSDLHPSGNVDGGKCFSTIIRGDRQFTLRFAGQDMPNDKTPTCPKGACEGLWICLENRKPRWIPGWNAKLQPACSCPRLLAISPPLCAEPLCDELGVDQTFCTHWCVAGIASFSASSPCCVLCSVVPCAVRCSMSKVGHASLFALSVQLAQRRPLVMRGPWWSSMHDFLQGATAAHCTWFLPSPRASYPPSLGITSTQVAPGLPAGTWCDCPNV